MKDLTCASFMGGPAALPTLRQGLLIEGFFRETFLFCDQKRKRKKSRCSEAANPGPGDCGVASKGPQLSVAKLGSEQCSPQRGE